MISRFLDYVATLNLQEVAGMGGLTVVTADGFDAAPPKHMSDYGERVPHPRGGGGEERRVLGWL